MLRRLANYIPILFIPTQPYSTTTTITQFRGVSLELVTEQAMASNVPDPELSALTKPAKFNGVDAFLTHSWSDDPKVGAAHLAPPPHDVAARKLT